MREPYYVSRDVRPNSSGGTWITTWAIKHHSDGIICWLDDVTYAYRLCDLLNRDELTCEGRSSTVAT